MARVPRPEYRARVRLRRAGRAAERCARAPRGGRAHAARPQVGVRARAGDHARRGAHRVHGAAPRASGEPGRASAPCAQAPRRDVVVWDADLHAIPSERLHDAKPQWTIVDGVRRVRGGAPSRAARGRGAAQRPARTRRLRGRREGVMTIVYAERGDEELVRIAQAATGAPSTSWSGATRQGLPALVQDPAPRGGRGRGAAGRVPVRLPRAPRTSRPSPRSRPGSTASPPTRA